MPPNPILPPTDDLEGEDAMPDLMPTPLPPERAMDGSLPLRPGDPQPAPEPDRAPLFSTDPLGEE